MLRLTATFTRRITGSTVHTRMRRSPRRRRERRVQHVEMHLLREDAIDVVADAIARIEDLGLLREGELAEPGHAGSDSEDLAVLLLVAARRSGILRSRPDEAHLAAEHVPELRKLVELRPREEAARCA